MDGLKNARFFCICRHNRDDRTLDAVGGIPTLDIRPVCRGIASQSADPGIGQGGQAETFQRCVESEQAVREEIKKKWPAFSAADKQHCVTLAKTGGESSNTELLTVWKWREMHGFCDLRPEPFTEKT